MWSSKFVLPPKAAWTTIALCRASGVKTCLVVILLASKCNNAVAERRVADAVESLRYALLEGGTSAGIMTVSALATTLRRLAAAKSARHGPSAAADVAAALKIPEWMARPAVAQARRWSADEIASAIATLADLSVVMKGGYEGTGALSEEQKRYVLETAVIAMATPAAQRG